MSNPPEFVLLNAVPGVDDEEEAHYLGDGPWDMMQSVSSEFEPLFAEMPPLSADDIRQLLLERAMPSVCASSSAETRAELLRLVDEIWSDIDGCYDDDWERPARPAERRWLCEYLIKQLTVTK
jgi:hypothetical protein